jgi:hypothetical protein
MSDVFLEHLMRFVLDATQAERGMAVNPQSEVVSLVNINEEETRASDFTGFRNIEQAFEANEKPYITNNLIVEPNMAPTTNTNFANLRLVLVFAFEGIGAVYIDQHIRQGVIKQDVAEQVQQLMDTWVQHAETGLTYEEMIARYRQDS